MSFQAMAAVVPLRLPTNEKFVLLMLANYADQDGKCWPSIGRLASDTGLCESSVRNAIKTLRDYSGFIAVQRRVDEDGRQTSNNYLLDIELCLKLRGGEGVRGTGGGVTDRGGRVYLVEGEGVPHTPEPIIEPINKEPTPLSAETPTSGFLKFWEALPAKRRNAKTGCWKVWKRKRLELQAATIIAHVEAMKRTKDWQQRLHPVTDDLPEPGAI